MGRDSKSAQKYILDLYASDKFSHIFPDHVLSSGREAEKQAAFSQKTGAKVPGRIWALPLRTRLDQQGAAGIVAGFCTVVGNLFRVVVAQVIDAQAVLFLVHDGYQLGFQGPQLGGVYQALEDAVLDPLAEILALFGDAAQAALSGGILGVHVVADQY